MIVAKKFLFENDFDEPMPLREKPVAPVAAAKAAIVIAPEPVVVAAPTYSEEELAEACAQARREGEQQGHQRGIVEGQQRLEAQIAAALSTISAQLTLAVRAATEKPVEITQAATDLALAILRKMHPALSAKRGLDEVESVLATCLEQLKNEPRLVAYVPNNLLDPLNERVGTISAARGFEGRVVLIGDPDLADSDCRIEWADGGLERDTRRLWADIETALDRCLGQPGDMNGSDGLPATS
jgi:flagellar assembly protein FliH